MRGQKALWLAPGSGRTPQQLEKTSGEAWGSSFCPPLTLMQMKSLLVWIFSEDVPGTVVHAELGPLRGRKGYRSAAHKLRQLNLWKSAGREMGFIEQALIRCIYVITPNSKISKFCRLFPHLVWWSIIILVLDSKCLWQQLWNTVCENVVKKHFEGFVLFVFSADSKRLLMETVKILRSSLFWGIWTEFAGPCHELNTFWSVIKKNETMYV